MELISSAVTFVASFVVVVLDHRWSKRNWEFIHKWSWFALAIISMTVGAMEQANEQARTMMEQLPKQTYVCVSVKDAYGISTRKCDWVTKPGTTPPPPSLSPLVDMIGGIFVSVLVDIPFALAGLALGKGVVKRMGPQSRVNQD